MTVSTWSASSRLLPDLVALGREEGEDHAAADEEAVGGLEQVVDDPELVGHLRTAEHHGIRALGVLGQALEHVDLGRDEAADRGRQQPRDVVDAGLLAVHDTEAVGDEDVCETRRARRRTRPAPSSSLAVSPGLKRRFSSSTTSPSCGRLDRGLGAARRRCRWRSVTSLPSTSPRRRRDRGQGVLRLRRALGPPEVGAHDDAGARLGQGLDRRRGRADAAVVGDGRAVERHVEVRPDEDALAAQVAQVGDGLHAAAPSALRATGRRGATRSTRRLE